VVYQEEVVVYQEEVVVYQEEVVVYQETVQEVVLLGEQQRIMA
jgi:hypothetical protein